MLPREARLPARPPLIAVRRLALALTAAALAAAGCGDEEDSDSGAAAPSDETALTVSLDPDGPDGKEAVRTQEVACDGNGDEACAAIAELDVAALTPVPPDAACTQIYGGPDVATLEGTIDGEEVAYELTRSGGCEIERFDAAVPLLQAIWPDYEPGTSLQP